MSAVTFKKVGHQWRVYADGQSLGFAWANGSRIRERSWNYRTAQGIEGRASSRQSAAEAMVRRAAKAGA